MANKIKSNKKKSGATRVSKTAQAKVQGVLGGLDAAARQYAMILADPCNAPLTRPVYAGTSSGYLTRIRYRFVVGSNSNFMMEFTPSCIHLPEGILWGAYNSGSTAIGYQDALTGKYVGSLLNIMKAYRPVAACVKILYYGAESARAGTLGMCTMSEGALPDAGATGQTTSQYFQLCPRPVRLGVECHEVRWAPTIVDQDFVDTSVTTANRTGGSMLVVGEYVPGNTIAVEYTAVLEWLPQKDSGLVTNLAPPASRNSLNDVLRALGPTARWAYSEVKDAVITAVQPTMAAIKAGALAHPAARLAAGVLGV